MKRFQKVIVLILAALIVLGFLVAYAAMFGFDKLQEIMKWKKVDA